MWTTQPLQRKGADDQPLGLWHLCASSDEDGGFHPGCDHDHPSAEEAQNCKDALRRVGEITGFPYREEEPSKPALTDAQVRHMTERFLQWKLPSTFQPDAGISFKPVYNETSPFGPSRHEPSGTNLFDYTQAEAMIRNMLVDLPKG